jgi:hypothetical protein
MTTTDHTETTTQAGTSDRPMRWHWRPTTPNVATAVASLGLSIVLGTLLPLPVYKALAGIAGVVAVVSIGAMAYRRFVQEKDAPVVEEAPDGR